MYSNRNKFLDCSKTISYCHGYAASLISKLAEANSKGTAKWCNNQIMNENSYAPQQRIMSHQRLYMPRSGQI